MRNIIHVEHNAVSMAEVRRVRHQKSELSAMRGDHLGIDIDPVTGLPVEIDEDGDAEDEGTPPGNTEWDTFGEVGNPYGEE